MKLGAAAPVVAAFLLAFASVSVAHAQPAPCEQAGRDAERQYALPSGLLLAIGRVESGRWDAVYQRMVPWPWAIDAAGEPRLVSTKQDAVNQTRALQAGGLRNIDVGCFQINLQSHPSAFADLEQAFDPVANAQYAARFLSSLHERLGSWEAAVAAYHSSVPERGLPYRDAVYTRWRAPNAVGVPLPDVQPVVVYAIGGIRISVWTPSRIGTAARLVAVPQDTPSATQLPRVISAAR